MGANGITLALPGNLTAVELKAKFNDLWETSRIEDGCSYSGSWGMMRGLEIRNTVFASENEADEYVLKHTEKWSNALAVRFRRVTEVSTKEPTFDGKPRRPNYSSVLQGYVSVSVDYRPDPAKNDPYATVPVIVAADQLSPTQREAVRAAAKAYWNGNVEYDRLLRARDQLLQAFDPPTDPANSRRETIAAERAAWCATKWDWKPVKKAHREMVAALRATIKAKATLDKLEAKFAPKLHTMQNKDEGEFWLIGGWAAS